MVSRYPLSQHVRSTQKGVQTRHHSQQSAQLLREQEQELQSHDSSPSQLMGPQSLTTHTQWKLRKFGPSQPVPTVSQVLPASHANPELLTFEDDEEQEHPPSQDEHQVSDDERISNDLVSGSEHYDSDSDNFIQDDVVKKQLTLFGEGRALTDKPDDTILPHLPASSLKHMPARQISRNDNSPVNENSLRICMGVDPTLPKKEQDKLVRIIRDQVRIASRLAFNRAWTSYHMVDRSDGSSPASRAVKGSYLP